jgi:hypothetical protein
LFATLSNGGRQIEATRLNVRVVNGVGITAFRVDRDKAINPQDVVSYNLEVIPVTRLTIKGLALSPEHGTFSVSQVTPLHAFPKFKAAPTNGR